MNADASQAYRQVSVGVAAPFSSDLAQAPHHLFSFVDCVPRSLNASIYRDRVELLLANHSLWQRGDPLFVGGSLFYVKSLFFKLPDVEGQEPEFLNFPLARPEGLTDWEYLKLVDPVRALHVHPNDGYRIERALELYFSSGVLPSLCQPRFDPVAKQSVVVWVDVPDDQLRATIRTRIAYMLTCGWIEEVEGFVGTRFEEFARDGYALGYDDVYQWVVGGKLESAYAPLVQTLELKTWDYVRRQRKFWRSFKRQLAQHGDAVQIVEGSHQEILAFFENKKN